MIRPKNEIEDLFLSKTKICETLIKQTRRKAEETLEFKLTKPRDTFSFEPSPNLGLDSNWMVGLTSLEVHKSIFIITQEKINLELCTEYSDVEFSFVEMKDKIAEVLSLSHISPEDLQHKIH